MDPEGKYCRQLSDLIVDVDDPPPPPKPSAPPIDQECLLSASAPSLDPPEEDVAGLTIDRGRSHHLEPPGVADGMVDRVAATYSIPTISNTTLTELPVASAVPIVTDAMGADADTTAASSSLSKHSNRAKITTRRRSSAAQKNDPNAQQKKVSLEELLRREKNQSKTSNVSKTRKTTEGQRLAHTQDTTSAHRCNEEEQKGHKKEQGPENKASKERDRQEWIDAHGLTDTRDFFAGMDAKVATKPKRTPRFWGKLSSQERQWRRKEEAASTAARRELQKRYKL